MPKFIAEYLQCLQISKHGSLIQMINILWISSFYQYHDHMILNYLHHKISKKKKTEFEFEPIFLPKIQLTLYMGNPDLVNIPT